MRKSFFSSALIAGLIAGALDIIAACLNAYIKTSTPPMQVLKGIASGVFGREAITGGPMMAVWGLIFHFIIAISFTFLFFFLAKQIPSLVKYPLVIGVLYGLLVWAAMRFLVLPYLSTLNPRPIVGNEAIKNAMIAAAIIVVCVGIPVAFLAKRYVRAKV
jgi:uncharacterized membrane protein YagU involved in acid resistance